MKKLGNITFVDVLDVSAADFEKVREMRNHPDIRKFMYTDHVISIEEHGRWKKMLQNGIGSVSFAIYRSGDLAGVVSLTGISSKHRRADWGYYLDVTKQGGGTGVLVEYALLEHAFSIIK